MNVVGLLRGWSLSFKSYVEGKRGSTEKLGGTELRGERGSTIF